MKPKPNRSSIFYTTYGFFANCAQFLDFQKDYFDDFIFLNLKSHNIKGKGKSTLFWYKNGKKVDKVILPTLPSNPPIFIVPFYHLHYVFIIMLGLIISKFKFKIVPKLFISSFSLWAFAACIMRSFGFCGRVILWSWDYYPLVKNTPYYWIQVFLHPLEGPIISWCDYSWYAAKAQFDKRVEIGQIKDPKNPKHRVVHWGNCGDLKAPIPSNYKKTGVLRLIYCGSILYEKGLSILIDSISELLKVTKDKLEVLILGPETPYARKLKDEIRKKGVKDYFKFKGYVPFNDQFKYTNTSDLGLALFVPEIGGDINFSHYADPAKPRTYLGMGLPVLITKVPEIHKDITKYSAGIVLSDYTPKALISAIKKYMKDPEKFKIGAFNLSQTDRYDEYYKKQFDSLL